MKTKDITLLGIITAIIIIMTAVPGLGYIPLGPVNATIVHIPVLIVAIVKGPKLGALLGLVFGISSMLNAILRPNPTSFLFMNPIISVLPRIMIGILAGLVANAIKRKRLKYNMQVGIPAALGSLVNTIGVLSLIYIIYAQRYLEAIGKTGQAALSVIGYIALTNGLVEMIVSIIIVTPIAIALNKIED